MNNPLFSLGWIDKNIDAKQAKRIELLREKSYNGIVHHLRHQSLYSKHPLCTNVLSGCGEEMSQLSVRNSAKAIVVHDGKMLVNRCTSKFGEYYALPGGGQHTGEMLNETVRREVLEETGYTVIPTRLSGIYERISEGRRDGNSHKIYFIFLCRLESEIRKTPTETDRFQIGIEWVDLHRIQECSLFPRAIRDNISGLIGRGETIFIGSEKNR